MLSSLDCLHVAFTFDTLAGNLLDDLTARFPCGWTGVVGANGAGKTTLLRLAVGDLPPQRGRVNRPSPAVYCAQRTDEPPPDLAGLLAATDGAAAALRGRLEVADDWWRRWSTLSHGERKRAQVAAALWRRPRVLALDEPTNHLDAAARGLLERALRGFDGIGLLVSHDRALLDGLCGQCLFLDPPRAVLRPGGYTRASLERQREEAHARTVRQKALHELKRIEAERSRRRSEAAREPQLRSKRGLAPRDHDARARIDAARVADGKSGAALRQMEGRAAQAARLLYVPQEVAADGAAAVIAEVRRLSHAELGRVLQIVCRLGSEPRRLLETERPSPGETRKLLLALGVLRSVHLVVLDEPTNHLDLPSIECVEGALRDYPGALLLVSHDERFLGALTDRRWQIACGAPGGGSRLVVRHPAP